MVGPPKLSLVGLSFMHTENTLIHGNPMGTTCGLTLSINCIETRQLTFSSAEAATRKQKLKSNKCLLCRAVSEFVLTGNIRSFAPGSGALWPGSHTTGISFCPLSSVQEAAKWGCFRLWSIRDLYSVDKALHILALLDWLELDYSNTSSHW